QISLPVVQPAPTGRGTGRGSPLGSPYTEGPSVDSPPKEKCGVFGVWGGPNSVMLSYLGLYAQQHRGQESAGIAVSDGERLSGITGMGLVPEIFQPEDLEGLEEVGGRGAI